MQRRPSQPAIPAALLAAAVMLSISASAEVTVAAALLNAGRQMPARALADAEALGQWLSRYSDVARQLRQLLTDDASHDCKVGLDLSGIDFIALEKLLKTTAPFTSAFHCGSGLGDDGGSLSQLPASSADVPRPAAPIRDNLTDLPPPLR